MQKIWLVVAMVLMSFNLAKAGEVGADCIFDGRKLFGDVKIVDSFPDFKVKKVSSLADIKVKEVANFATNCGDWRYVNSFPDFTVQFVDSFADFTIQEVSAFPGVK